MRRLAALSLLLILAACEGPDRSGVEDVFLEREAAKAPMAYEALRDKAYDTLRKEGPDAALPLFQTAYASPGAEAVSWELLPVIARLKVIGGDRATAATHLRTARLAHRLSLGEVVCKGPNQGVFTHDGNVAYGPEDLGSALLVSTTMCATRDIYPPRSPAQSDALFDRKLAAVETLLSGASEAGKESP